MIHESDSRKIEQHAEKIIDDDTLDFKDVEISPSHLLMRQLIKIQNCFDGVGVKDGIMKYHICVLALEAQVRAQKKLPENYDDTMKNYKVEVDKTDDEQATKIFKVAAKRYELILPQIYDTRSIDTPMQL